MLWKLAIVEKIKDYQACDQIVIIFASMEISVESTLGNPFDSSNWIMLKKDSENMRKEKNGIQ